jgi:coatomer protein complex subunit alpha (xenin)
MNSECTLVECVATLNEPFLEHKYDENDSCEEYINHIYSVAFHPTEPLIAVGSQDHTFKLWQINYESSEAECLVNLIGSIDSVYCIVFHPSEPLIATCGFTCAKLWRLNDKYRAIEHIATLEHEYYVFSTVFHPYAPLIVTSSFDGDIKLWRMSNDRTSVECVSNFKAHKGSINSVVFHPTKPILLTASNDKTIKLWQ